MKRLLDMVTFAGPKKPTDRMSIFTFLQYNDYPTPDSGKVSELSKRHEGLEYIILWAEPGRGRIMRLVEASRRYPDAFAAMFLGDLMTPYTFIRQVQLGDRTYWCEYVGVGWGKDKGKVIRYVAGYHEKIKAPLFSIDFIKKGTTTYAIDFDMIPPIRNSGLREIVSPKDVRKLIRKAEKQLAGQP